MITRLLTSKDGKYKYNEAEIVADLMEYIDRTYATLRQEEQQNKADLMKIIHYRSQKLIDLRVSHQKNPSQIKMDNGILIFIVVVIILVGGIWLYQTLVEGYANSGFPYAQLGGSYNTQLFSPCVSKRCAGGPYMYTSNPYLQSLCQGVSNEELAQVACGKGFHGRPVHFDYSGLSESVNVGPSINVSAPIPTLSKNLEKCGKNLQYGAWGNALCNTPSTTSLCVL